MRCPHAGQFASRFWASGGVKFPKMGDSQPWTLMNRLTKFDATSFILGGEVCIRTNRHKKPTSMSVSGDGRISTHADGEIRNRTNAQNYKKNKQ